MEPLHNLSRAEQLREVLSKHPDLLHAAVNERKMAVKATLEARRLERIHLDYQAAANTIIHLVKFSDQAASIPKDVQERIHQLLLPLLINGQQPTDGGSQV